MEFTGIPKKTLALVGLIMAAIAWYIWETVWISLVVFIFGPVALAVLIIVVCAVAWGKGGYH